MATTPLQGLTVPTDADGPLGGTQIATLGAAVEKQLVMRYASASARDTAIPAANRVEGMVCWLQDTDQLYVCDATGSGGVWRSFTQGPAWTAFTPTFTATGGGAISLTQNRIGRWRQIGTRVDVEFYHTWGSLGTGEALGSGSYTWGLPVSPNAWYPTGFPVGTAIYQVPGAFSYPAIVTANGASVFLEFSTGTVGKAGPTIPVVPSNSDRYLAKISYDV